MDELAELAGKPGGLSKILSPLISGSLSESPFPEAATLRIREFMDSVAPAVKKPDDAKEQPVDVELLHRLLVLADDPDAEVMLIY